MVGHMNRALGYGLNIPDDNPGEIRTVTFDNQPGRFGGQNIPNHAAQPHPPPPAQYANQFPQVAPQAPFAQNVHGFPQPPHRHHHAPQNFQLPHPHGPDAHAYDIYRPIPQAAFYPGYAAYAQQFPPLPHIPPGYPVVPRPYAVPQAGFIGGAQRAFDAVPEDGRNATVLPGHIYIATAWIEGDDERSSFDFQTDIPWDDFLSRSRAKLNDPQAVLGYKLTGDSMSAKKKPLSLENADHFREAMMRLNASCRKAKSKRFDVYIYNKRLQTSDAGGKKGKGKKRTREDDIPPPSTEMTDPRVEAMKKLKDHTRCEAHNGYCLVSTKGGQQLHGYMAYEHMDDWVEQMVLGRASIFQPPHDVQFDVLNGKKRPRKRDNKEPTTIVSEVHLNINGAGAISIPQESQESSNASHKRARLDSPSSSRSFASRTVPLSPSRRQNLSTTTTVEQPSSDSPHPPVPSTPTATPVLRTPTIHDALVALDSAKPDGQYLNLEPRLRFIGASYIGDLLTMQPSSIAETAGIPIVQVNVVYEYAEKEVARLKDEELIRRFQEEEDFMEKFFGEKENYHGLFSDPQEAGPSGARHTPSQGSDEDSAEDGGEGAESECHEHYSPGDEPVE